MNTRLYYVKLLPLSKISIAFFEAKSIKVFQIKGILMLGRRFLVPLVTSHLHKRNWSQSSSYENCECSFTKWFPRLKCKSLLPITSFLATVFKTHSNFEFHRPWYVLNHCLCFKPFHLTEHSFKTSLEFLAVHVRAPHENLNGAIKSSLVSPQASEELSSHALPWLKRSSNSIIFFSFRILLSLSWLLVIFCTVHARRSLCSILNEAKFLVGPYMVWACVCPWLHLEMSSIRFKHPILSFITQDWPRVSRAFCRLCGDSNWSGSWSIRPRVGIVWVGTLRHFHTRSDNGINTT